MLLEDESGFTGCFGQGADASVVLIAGAVENDSGNASSLGGLCELPTDGASVGSFA